MKNLFDPARAEEVRHRLAHLHPDNLRQWGKMNPAQMLAHCTAGFEMAEGQIVPPRILIGRLLGPIEKRSLIVNGEPMRRNAKTAPSAIVADERNFTFEQKRLREAIDHFVTAGPAICTSHPHFFLGPLTPQEWAALMYQHLDHHLRQFGV